MTNANQQKYFVIPLSVQREDEGYLVGNQELEDFYQFPEEGLRIIQLLQQGQSPELIKQHCNKEFDDTVDVDDFIGVLSEIGFIYPLEQAASFEQQLQAAHSDGRWKFPLSQKFAAGLFSLPMLLLYLAIVGYAVVSAVADPQLRINIHAFYIQDNLTILLLALLVLQAFTTALHEFGHMAAAAKYGIQSRLGWGNRLWSIVAEADLSGIHALPKRQRYFPLLAGLMVDLLNIACITLLIKFLIEIHTYPFIIQIFQVLILQILFTMSWQFNLFLRTDIYYVLCVYCNYPNLDAEARIYLRALLHRVSAGRLGNAGPAVYHNLRTLRIFTAIWIAGRMVALALLLFVIIPTLYRYGRDAYQAFNNVTVTTYDKWDLSLFFILSCALLGLGLTVWIRGKARLNKGN